MSQLAPISAGLLLAALTCTAPPASAARGLVVDVRQECAYFMVQSVDGARGGLALLELRGTQKPSLGNTVLGDFDSFGIKDIQNLTTGLPVPVRVENYALSEEDALERFRDLCSL